MQHSAFRCAATPARRLLIAGAVLALLTGGALAQAPAQPPAAATDQASDPVVAKVNGQIIHLSDLRAAAEELPANTHNVPPQKLYPMLLDQMIDGIALEVEARAAGLDKDSAVQHQMDVASERVLQTAMLTKIIGPSITEDALRARYQREIASKPAEDEVHARHILVDSEELAKKIIAELKQGADFVTLAKQYSKDPSAGHTGDLGFFRKDEMVPEFSAVAFSLKPGQIADAPVHTQFGWHVIQLLERRPAKPPSFEQVRDELRQKVIGEGIQQALAAARAKVTIERFNLDGSVPRATDTAEPPPTKP